MSDNWIIVAPKLPGYIPSADNVQVAMAIFKNLAPDSDEFEIIESEHTQLFDCGSNLENIECPKCKSSLEFDWWGEAMTKDFDESSGFHLKKYSVPCCPAELSLNELSYNFNQAFGRFALSAMNPNVGMLSSENLERLGAALGCQISVVYQHL